MLAAISLPARASRLHTPQTRLGLETPSCRDAPYVLTTVGAEDATPSSRPQRETISRAERELVHADALASDDEAAKLILGQPRISRPNIDGRDQ